MERWRVFGIDGEMRYMLGKVVNFGPSGEGALRGYNSFPRTPTTYPLQRSTGVYGFYEG